MYRILILLFIFVPRGGFQQFSSNNPKLQAYRALALLGGTTFNFLALKFLPITTTIAIFFAMPVVITVMSYLFLNENVGLTESFFMYKLFNPNFLPRFSAFVSGVIPAPILTIFDLFSIGSNSKYLQ